jgi:hypothetical protein
MQESSFPRCVGSGLDHFEGCSMLPTPALAGGDVITAHSMTFWG